MSLSRQVMVSDNEEENIEWMGAWLREDYTAYNTEMSSIGVFIPNGKSMVRFVKSMTEEDDLGKIKVIR